MSRSASGQIDDDDDDDNDDDGEDDDDGDDDEVVGTSSRTFQFAVEPSN